MPRAALYGIDKRFGDTQALRGARFEVGRGEIHALLGENGAGKSTLVRTLYGLVTPDRGEVSVNGAPVEIRGPSHALSLGIGLVHQHFMLVPALSVAENLALGDRGGVLLSRSAANANARALLAEYGLDVDPGQPTSQLGVAQRQRLEIVRALARGAQILILDEPTAVLAPSEVEDLLALLERLRSEGRSVVLITHKLDEITRVCDRVTVLRAGETVGSREVDGIDALELGRWMVGEDPSPPGAPIRATPGATALRIAGLHSEGLRGIDLEVSRGEIYALAGIDGNGQEPLEQVLAGVLPASLGTLEILASPLAVVSADRQQTGLVLEMSLAENLVLDEAASGGRPPAFRAGLVVLAELRRAANAAIERFAIHGQAFRPVRELSGGNQQKVCIARALRHDPGVLVAVNPTRGLDLGATAAVREELREQARGGAGVLLISTDLDEILELGDRIGVLFRGRIMPLESGRPTRAEIGQAMLGQAGSA